jgi:hypothetical protein
MTTSEFRKLVGQSPVSTRLNSLETRISFGGIGEPKVFKSIVDLYTFVSYQVENWEKLPKIDNNISGLKSYVALKDFLESSVQDYLQKSLTENELKQWTVYNLGQQNLSRFSGSFSDFKDPRSQFIARLSEEFDVDTALGAFYYFKESQSLGSYQPKQVKGLLMAYEFSANEKSTIFSRTKNELTSLRKLEKTYENAVSEINQQHVEHIAQSQDEYKKSVRELDSFKIEKIEEFNEWFSNSQQDFIKFSEGSSNRIEELEEIYEKKLQLEKPAKYWDKKSKEYYRQATLMRNIVTTVISIFGGFLMAILIISPERIFVSLQEPGNQAIFIRWAVIFVLLVSLVVFIVRALTKVMFSSYHLARDAEEKHTLTFFYLALINGTKSEISAEDRKMIIQSLFSRSDTGLLKGDSTPEMPNDFISKIFPKS